MKYTFEVLNRLRYRHSQKQGNMHTPPSEIYVFSIYCKVLRQEKTAHYKYLFQKVWVTMLAKFYNNQLAFKVFSQVKKVFWMTVLKVLNRKMHFKMQNFVCQKPTFCWVVNPLSPSKRTQWSTKVFPCSTNFSLSSCEVVTMFA